MNVVKYRVLTCCGPLHGKITRHTCQRGIENMRNKSLLVYIHLPQYESTVPDKFVLIPPKNHD
jgi:hypothetical protein